MARKQKFEKLVLTDFLEKTNSAIEDKSVVFEDAVSILLDSSL